LFFTYLLLDGFRGDKTVKDYQAFGPLLVGGMGCVSATRAYVPAQNVEAEKAPLIYLPNENVPLVWAQGLYLLSQLLSEGLLSIGISTRDATYTEVGTERQWYK